VSDRITFRTFTNDDAERCAVIIRATLGGSHASSFLRGLIDGWEAEHFVAESAGEVVGIASYCWPGFCRGYYTLAMLAVDVPMQGAGVGRALVEHLLTQMTGAKGLFVHSDVDAVAFYKRLGFVKVLDLPEGDPVMYRAAAL
jgi:ribosomal protein S18 acetylase RimI-like enzyme